MTRVVEWQRRRKDFKVDWFNGSGAGGQHRNRNKCCCRLTDLATGIQTESQDHRSAVQNKRAAFRKMVARLQAYYATEAAPRAHTAAYGQKTTRTYHEPNNRVTDHVTGREYSYQHTVGKGDLSGPISDRIGAVASTCDGLNDAETNQPV